MREISMKPRSVSLMLVAALVGGACASTPSEPSVMALPGSNKTLDQFRSDDHNCRQFALGQIGGTTSNSSNTGDDAQHRYDVAYVQCMYASGHRVPVYNQMLAAPPASPPANYKPDSPPPAPHGNAH